ncbi:MAG TPA: 3-carboxy-cis,cis-muconate cycloisomerase [Kofleriaceae bacterium]|nr:3-carboxy-cis,cis-muconate cycloisomerase [Kofleriaceae bacterium]
MSSGRAASTEAGLFDGVLARGAVQGAVRDRAWLQAMLDFEAGLARAQARAGLVSADDAAAIGRACRADDFDAAELGRAAAWTGTPVDGLVRALTAAVGGAAGDQVHRGATSQDVLDTAAMLVSRRALRHLIGDLVGAADAAAVLAARHRATPMAGRTLLQQALPITFGLGAAGWMVGLDEAIDRLVAVSGRLAVQLGGAAGTLASMGEAGIQVVAYLAEELGLAAPVLPWHTLRTRVAELAGALGEAAGAAGKPARDLALLAQTEVAEVREGGPRRGGSSSMPHKRNPVAAVSAAACAARAPGLVASLLASMVQEHQRAAGAWHAEWRPLAELLESVGAAAAWLRDALEHLEVDAARMRVNLDATGGMLLAERVTGALAPALGRLAAHDLVAAACAEAADGGRPLAEVLEARADIRAHLPPAQIRTLLDPASYLGSALVFVERALAAHADAGRRREEDA